ncbi:MAG: exosortase-associated EpsI family protein [Sedimentisphaerales bacterium]|nr:exosortase-associated EpsI family protein [Sedimentisphaerales bacterium]
MESPSQHHEANTREQGADGRISLLPTGPKNQSGPLNRFRRYRGAAPFWLAACLGVALFLVAGQLYRVHSRRIGSLEPISLPLALENLPLNINGWVGQTVEIDAATRRVLESSFADDYVSRYYVDSTEGMSANLYIVYCSTRMAGLTGHRPGVCYPAGGWILDEKSSSEFVSLSGRRVPCLLHRFHMRPPDYEERVVLSYYVLNGQVTLDEREFSDLWGRRLNFGGDYARYVAQVQVSSAWESSVLAAASALADTVFAFLPDPNGVQAASLLAEEYDVSGN